MGVGSSIGFNTSGNWGIPTALNTLHGGAAQDFFMSLQAAFRPVCEQQVNSNVPGIEEESYVERKMSGDIKLVQQTYANYCLFASLEMIESYFGGKRDQDQFRKLYQGKEGDGVRLEWIEYAIEQTGFEYEMKEYDKKLVDKAF